MILGPQSRYGLGEEEKNFFLLIQVPVLCTEQAVA
jgi:hypothetical protein